MSFLEKELQEIGFSDKEARIYLAGLELGATSAQELSQKSGVNRATTYVMIESLAERGLMSSVTKGKKRLFIAEGPNAVSRLIENEKNDIEKRQKKIDTILIDLINLSQSSAGVRPNVTFFEGEKGIESLRQSIIESGVDYVEEFSPIDDAYKYFPPVQNDYRDRFRQKVKHIKLIYSSKKGPFLAAEENNVSRRFIPSDKYPFTGDIAIYGSRVNIIYYGVKLMGVLIEHEGISNAFHQLFSLAWLGTEGNQKIKKGD
ncbi:MAG: helix-turn-helix domain-containing protein [Patescibacteria group bacterium]